MKNRKVNSNHVRNVDLFKRELPSTTACRGSSGTSQRLKCFTSLTVPSTFPFLSLSFYVLGISVRLQSPHASRSEIPLSGSDGVHCP